MKKALSFPGLIIEDDGVEITGKLPRSDAVINGYVPLL